MYVHLFELHRNNINAMMFQIPDVSTVQQFTKGT